MSERKTSEIKLRVTPSFKAAVQLAAEGAGETMSVYMEKATEDRRKSERLGGIAAYAGTVLNTPVGPSRFYKECVDCGQEWGQSLWCGACQLKPGSATQIRTAPGSVNPTDLNPVPPVAPDSVPASGCEKNCHPWEWCECKQKRRD